MPDYKDVIGNGNGCAVSLSEIQNDGTAYSTFYKDTLTAIDESGLPGVGESTALSQGVVENSANNQKWVFRDLQNYIQRQADNTYITQKYFYVNTTLTPAQVIAIMKAGNIVTDFIGHADTIALDANGIDKILLDKLI